MKTQMLLLEINNGQELIELKLEYQKLIKLHVSINSVLVTAQSNQTDYDIKSRVFWPWRETN